MAVDIFAKLGDIKGESTDAKHKDEIEVLSFSWGVGNSAPAGGGSAGGGVAGKTSFQDLVIVHTIDRASPKLMEACATGKHMKDAIITQRKAGKGQQDYLIVKMSDVLVTNVSLVSGVAQPPAETVSLTFAKIHYEYRPIKADGSPDAAIIFKYDITTGKSG